MRRRVYPPTGTPHDPHCAVLYLRYSFLARQNPAPAYQRRSHPRSRLLGDVHHGQPNKRATRRHHPPGSGTRQFLPSQLNSRARECHYGARHALNDACELCTTRGKNTTQPYSLRRPAWSNTCLAFQKRICPVPNWHTLAMHLGRHGLAAIRTWPWGNHEVGTLAHSNILDLHSRPDCWTHHRHFNKNEATGPIS